MSPDVPALVELRVLEGPNLYFPRAAVKLTLDLTRLVDAPTDVALRFASRVGLRTTQPGELFRGLDRHRGHIVHSRGCVP